LRRTPGTPTPVVGPAVLPSAPPLGAGSSAVDVAVAALEADRPH
ncbi:MAG: hypothetical protein JWM64_479, partial [Frankiales bacterium]|nr:hypothetical protein [Frankiales bacterium]